jgi:hypothetical protein
MRGMKKTAPHRKPAPIPTPSNTLGGREGVGGGGNGQTTAQALPWKKPNWRCGAPNGNRNAAKPVPALSTLQRRVRALKRRIRAAIAQVPT